MTLRDPCGAGPLRVVVFIATLVTACASPSPTPTAEPTATPSQRLSASPSASGDLAPPPSLAPMPSPGQLAEVALRFTGCDLSCWADPGLTVLKDGRVLRMSERGMSERQLTPAGMQQIRDAIDATGLFQRDADYFPTLNPGKQSGGFGPWGYDFSVAFGGGAVHVRSVEPSPFENDNRSVPGILGIPGAPVWLIPPQVDVLAALATKLGSLDAWLPPEAWAGATGPFVAQGYLLIVTTQHVEGELPTGPDIGAVRWPFPVSLDLIGEPYVGFGAVDGTVRCLVMDRQTAAALAAAEAEAGVGGRSLGFAMDARNYLWARGHGTVDVHTRMLLPYQAPTCLGASSW